MTFARNRAPWLFTNLFSGFIGRWIRKALFTTILGRFDLDPFPGPEAADLISIATVLTAFSPLFPLALCIFGAGVSTTRHALRLIDLTALNTTVLGLLGNNPVASLRAFWVILSRRILTLLRAPTPLAPFAFAINGTLLQFARLIMLCTVGVRALLTTMLRCYGDLEKF
jgi:hypothetical protein